jgi:predicted transcriptional regulator
MTVLGFEKKVMTRRLNSAKPILESVVLIYCKSD